jgi:hypothetical protein
MFVRFYDTTHFWDEEIRNLAPSDIFPLPPNHFLTLTSITVLEAVLHFLVAKSFLTCAKGVYKFTG